MPTAPRAPKGYRLVTRGKVREGDRLWDEEWYPYERVGDANSFIGSDVADCEAVARPVARGKRRRSK